MSQTKSVPAPSAGTQRRRRGTTIVLIIVGQSTQALAFGGIALFLPLIRTDLGITFSEAGTLGAVSTFVYALMQIPSGYLADRFEPKKLFAIGLVGVNLLSLSFALIHSYPLLLVNQGLSGVFRALLFAPGLVLMVQQFRADRRATAMGLYVIGGFSSNIVLNLIGPPLVGQLGWPLLIILFSISGVIVAIAFMLLASPAPKPAGTKSTSMRDLAPLLRHRAVWLTGVIQFVRLATVTGMAFWLPSLLIEDKGLSLTVTGLIVALSAAVVAPSNFLGGYVSDRLNRPLLLIGISLAAVGTSTVLLTFTNSLPLIIGIIVIESIFLQAYFGPLFALPQRYLGSGSAGVMSGFGNFCANLGGFATTATMGLIRDSTGSFSLALWIMGALCVVGIGAVVALRTVPVLEDVEPEPTIIPAEGVEPDGSIATRPA